MNLLGRASGILRTYGLAGCARLTRDWVLTKLTRPRARLIRRPVYVRNGRLIELGRDFTSGVGLRIEAYGEGDGPPLIRVGDRVQVNDYVHIGAALSVRIGNDVLIASKVFVSDHNHGRYSGPHDQDSPDSIPRLRQLVCAPVTIEDNVWIGEFVSVLPGVTIGRGSIVGSNSVVSRDIPPGVIAVGTPAVPVKRYDPGTGRWESLR